MLAGNILLDFSQQPLIVHLSLLLPLVLVAWLVSLADVFFFIALNELAIVHVALQVGPGGPGEHVGVVAIVVVLHQVGGGASGLLLLGGDVGNPGWA